MRRDFLTGKFGARLGISAMLILFTCANSVSYAQTSAAPYTTYTRYDVASRLVGTIFADPDGSGPIHYAAIRNTYSSLGLLATIEKGELATWQSQAISPAQWSGFTVYSRADFTYDKWGRKLTEQTSGVVSGVSTPAALTQYSYDTYGHAQCVAVRMNPAIYVSLPASACAQATPQGSQGPDRITQTTYNVASRPMVIQKGVGTSSVINYASYAYGVGTPNNAMGPQQSVTDANGNLSFYSYDPYLRLQAQYFPSKNATGQYDSADYEQYGYDLNGNRTSLKKRDGTVISETFDELNRVTLKHYSANATDVYFGYDLRGLQTYARFGSSTGVGVTTTYDGFGRVIQSSSNVSGATLTVTSGYDADGDRTSITHPDGNYFTYSYDGLDRVNLISENGAATLASFVYNSQGKISTLTRGGVVGSGVAATALTYDPVNRLQTLSHDLDGTATTNDVTYSFTYLPSTQIGTRNISNGEYAYSSGAVSTVYMVNGLNEYSAIVGSPSSNPTYDANGNMTYDGVTSYSFDAENRLTHAVNGLSMNASYDPMGRLSEFDAGTQVSETQYLYDGDALIGEYSSTGALLRRYVHGPGVDVPLVWYQGATVGSSSRSYLFADHLGSITAISNAGGTTTRVNTYDIFGNPASGNGGTFQFTGQMYISQLGLYYYRARYYSPQLGRFLQTDPVGYKDDFDLYSYVGNDPLDRTDPSGLKCQGAGNDASCTFDEFKDKKGNVITREQATSGGNRLTKALKMDPASRVARQEAAMTAKYKSALAMQESGGSVTISGDKSLGVADQTVSGGTIVSAMQSTPLVSTEKSGPSSNVLAGAVKVGATGQVLRIEFYSSGAGVSNFGQLFGHEELHAAYERPSATDAGWDTPSQKFQDAHQGPFNSASDDIDR
jgi:RHS repeat-associated protein